MRKSNLLVALIVLLCIFSSYSQNTPGFKYQTIVRDGKNNIVPNHYVRFRMTIVQGTTIGTPVYREQFLTKTNLST